MTVTSARRTRVDPMRRRPAGRDALDDRVERHAGRQPDGGGGEPVVDREPAERRVAAGRRSPAGTQREPHPVGACGRHGLRADVRIVGEAVGHGPRRGPRRHPADDRVVGVEDGRAGSRQRLEELALGRLDGLDAADPRQVDRLDGGHDPDGRPRHGGEVGDLAADVHPHLEDRGLMLGAELAGASAAGRSRCSGSRRFAASGSAGRGPRRRPPSSRSWRCSP